MSDMTDATPVNNVAAHRFEMDVDGELATLVYDEREHVIDFTHTEVPPALEGHGVGTRLIQAGLAYAKASGKRVIATCPFVSAYIERHPDAA